MGSQSPEHDLFVNELNSSDTQSYVLAHLDASWRGIDRTNEVAAVQEYLLRRGVGVDYLNQNVARHFKLKGRYELKFASVFCHKKPIVRRVPSLRNPCRGSTASCELGDLLLVFVFANAHKRPLVVRACLAQAKVERRFDSKSQACLYDRDEEFLLPKSVWQHSPLTFAQRYLPSYGGSRAGALKYLVLNPKETYPSVYDVPSTSPFHRRWSTAVMRLIHGADGYPFDASKVVANHWDGVLNDLFMIGAGRIKSSTVRGNDAVEDLVNTFNHFDQYDNFNKHVDGREGVPMMLVIVRDREAKAG